MRRRAHSRRAGREDFDPVDSGPLPHKRRRLHEAGADALPSSLGNLIQPGTDLKQRASIPDTKPAPHRPVSHHASEALQLSAIDRSLEQITAQARPASSDAQSSPSSSNPDKSYSSELWRPNHTHTDHFKRKARHANLTLRGGTTGLRELSSNRQTVKRSTGALVKDREFASEHRASSPCTPENSQQELVLTSEYAEESSGDELLLAMAHTLSTELEKGIDYFQEQIMSSPVMKASRGVLAGQLFTDEYTTQL